MRSLLQLFSFSLTILSLSPLMNQGNKRLQRLTFRSLFISLVSTDAHHRRNCFRLEPARFELANSLAKNQNADEPKELLHRDDAAAPFHNDSHHFITSTKPLGRWWLCRCLSFEEGGYTRNRYFTGCCCCCRELCWKRALSTSKESNHARHCF